MTSDCGSGAGMVSLREPLVARLIQLRTNPGKPIENVVARLAAEPNPAPRAKFRLTVAKKMDSGANVEGKHMALVLGERVVGHTLGRLFANVVDLIAEIDPGVLHRLERIGARKRGYISRSSNEIHPNRPDLATIQAGSGWWVSGNVGKEDVRRGLAAVCQAADLEFGTDIRFPISR